VPIFTRAKALDIAATHRLRFGGTIFWHSRGVVPGSSPAIKSGLITSQLSQEFEQQMGFPQFSSVSQATMKAAIITPYYKEDISVLRRCHLSALGQELKCRHFMVADGFPSSEVCHWDCEHIILSEAHADNGNTPRSIGAISAINQGYEAIFFLDADNWYCPNHASEALNLKRSNPEIDIAVLGRNIILPDGTPVNEDREDLERTHIDTSCYCFFESAFELLPLWGMMNPFLGPICDRIMFLAIKQKKFKLAWSQEKTCYFTSNYKNHYRLAGIRPPVKTNDTDRDRIIKLFKQYKTQFQSRTGLDIDLK
jgi:hypothetical protein